MPAPVLGRTTIRGGESRRQTYYVPRPGYPPWNRFDHPSILSVERVAGPPMAVRCRRTPHIEEIRMNRIVPFLVAAILTVGGGLALVIPRPHAVAAATRATPRPGAPAPRRRSVHRFDGSTGWINSPPLTVAGLQGHVVVVDFWAFSCSNCLAALPHVETLEAKFRDRGVVVSACTRQSWRNERVESNLASVRRLAVVYPVAIDEATGSGTPSTTNIGRRSTSSMSTAASDITTSARAHTMSRNRLSRRCSTKRRTIHVDSGHASGHSTQFFRLSQAE